MLKRTDSSLCSVGSDRSARPQRRFPFVAALAVFAAFTAGFASAASTLPTMSSSASGIAFSTVGNTQIPNAQTLTIKGSSNSKPNLVISVADPTATWLTVVIPATVAPVTLTIRANPAYLPVGRRSTNILVTSPDTSNQLSIPVMLNVQKAAPGLTTDAPGNAIAFAYTTSGALPIASQTVNIGTNGSVPLSFTASVKSAPWLTITPATGIAAPGRQVALKLTANPVGQAPGTLTGIITVASATASNKSVNVQVTLTIQAGTAVLTAVWPPKIPMGSPDTTITLTGTNLFLKASTVKIGATVVNPTWASSMGDAIMAVVPAAAMAAAQPALTITVSNSPQPDSNALPWPVTDGKPHIWAVTSWALGDVIATPLIAPGELVTIVGSGLGPAAGANGGAVAPNPAGFYPLGTAPGTVVDFQDSTNTWFPAPLTYVDDTQVNAQVPYGLTLGAGIKVRVTYNGFSDTTTVTGQATHPAIVTSDGSGQGQAAVLNADGTVNSSKNSAVRNSQILIYVTGAGLLSATPSPEGQIVPAAPAWTVSATPITVTIGTDTVNAASAHAVVGSISGLVEVAAVVPTTVKPGKSVALSVTIGTQTSQPNVTLVVK